MNPGREGDVVATFVALTSKLARGHDVLDLLSDLTTSCATLLDVESAGLLLADGLGELHVVAASSEATRQLELFQLQRDQGPCLECYRTGAPVSVADPAEVRARWPAFAPAMRGAGFASIHAVPLRLGEVVLGALGLFGANPGELGHDDLVLGRALADVAAVALVRDREAVDRVRVAEQLQQALLARVVLEQAKGLLAYSGRTDVAEAFVLMRDFARDRGERLSDVARALVSRSLHPRAVLDHRGGDGPRQP